MREAHELALRDWVILGTGLDEQHVIWAASPGAPPRPTKPYATVLILSEVMEDPVNTMTDTPQGAGFALEQDSFVTGTVSVQIFGDGHRALMADLVLSVRVPDVTELFQTTGVVVTMKGSGGFSEDQPSLSTSFEQRTQRDFVFTFVRSRAIEAQPIETVEVTGVVG